MVKGLDRMSCELGNDISRRGGSLKYHRYDKSDDEVKETLKKFKIHKLAKQEERHKSVEETS